VRSPRSFMIAGQDGADDRRVDQDRGGEPDADLFGQLVAASVRLRQRLVECGGTLRFPELRADGLVARAGELEFEPDMAAPVVDPPLGGQRRDEP
jgi:hypothetical protein